MIKVLGVWGNVGIGLEIYNAFKSGNGANGWAMAFALGVNSVIGLACGAFFAATVVAVAYCAVVASVTYSSVKEMAQPVGSYN